MTPDPFHLLAALGTTPDALAQSLLARGIRGQPRHASRCPLAVYLRQEGVQDPHVHAEVLYWTSGGRERSAVLLEPVLGFLQALDRGAYPELVQP